MKRDQDFKENLVGIRIEKDTLVGTRIKEPTGKCRLVLLTPAEGDKENYTIINPYLNDQTEKTELPMTVLADIIKNVCKTKGKKKLMHVSGQKLVNQGTQIVFTIKGEVDEVIQLEKPKTKPVKGEKIETEKVIFKPLFTQEIGKHTFEINLLHVHRYDRVKAESHLDVRFNGISFFIERGANSISAWTMKTLVALSEVKGEILPEIQKLIREILVGYGRRDAIGKRQEATIDKFNSLCATMQDKGILVFGENALGAFWGAIEWMEENMMDGTYENDFMGATEGPKRKQGRDMVDKLFREVCEACDIIWHE